MTSASCFAIDDLRRFGAALGAGVGLAPARAAALASHLLWFDTAGAAHLGFSTLSGLLDAIAAGDVAARAEGTVGPEQLATAVFDAGGGVPLLALERAAELAAEKAREAGFGLVRVTGLGPLGSAAGAAAGIAIGPYAAAALGPDGRHAVALPSPEGLPLVFDPALTVPDPGPKPKAAKTRAKPKAGPTVPPVLDAVGVPWAAALVPAGGWLVLAARVTAVETLDAFHTRVGARLGRLDERDGLLLPPRWEERRRSAREAGVAVGDDAWSALLDRARRSGIEAPAPLGG